MAGGALISLLSVSAAVGQPASGDRCETLRNLLLDAAYVTSARVMEAAGDLPAYCEVRATARPAISIEVRLPIEGWNGGLYQTGCGGFCGILGRADAGGGFINAMGPGLRKGYATATSDSGHHGLSVADASWADSNPQAERDWGWRSIGETNRVAGALVEAYYETTTDRAIFQGCSTGGRMAHRAALIYPDMFDGIISGAPAIDYTGLVATAFAWLVQANTDESGDQILKPGKDKIIGDEVMAQCDAVDGSEDGLIEDPRACAVDLTAIACGSGEAGDQCLTGAELQVVETWREGPRNSAGEQLYPGGIPEGSERFWSLWLLGDAEGAPGFVPPFAASFGAFMAFPDDPGPSYSPLAFDFDRDPPRLDPMAEVYNADETDLGEFIAGGGKMIVWHGWADPLVTPYKTVAWFDDLAQASGGRDELEKNVRLFMMPGMDHCGILPGPDGIDQSRIDPLTALEAWVEDGAAPTTILTER